MDPPRHTPTGSRIDTSEPFQWNGAAILLRAEARLKSRISVTPTGIFSVSLCLSSRHTSQHSSTTSPSNSPFNRSHSVFASARNATNSGSLEGIELAVSGEQRGGERTRVVPGLLQQAHGLSAGGQSGRTRVAANTWQVIAAVARGGLEHLGRWASASARRPCWAFSRARSVSVAVLPGSLRSSSRTSGSLRRASAQQVVERGGRQVPERLRAAAAAFFRLRGVEVTGIRPLLAGLARGVEGERATGSAAPPASPGRSGGRARPARRCPRKNRDAAPPATRESRLPFPTPVLDHTTSALAMCTSSSFHSF